MAVVLRSNSDLVYLPDHGFIGEEGALRILVQVTRQIRRLDVSHNLLGSEGTLTLIQGLNSLRGRYSTPELGLWGLTEINLGCNAITDAAIDGIMGYAKKDVMLRRVLLQGNDIQLDDNLDSFIHTLNSSRLKSLSLTNNKTLKSSAVSKLFDSLNTPYLTELHVSICNLGNEVVESIVSYLTSSRSRHLEMLELNGNRFGLEGVQTIIDTVEKGNFTLRHLGLFACSSKPMATVPTDDDMDVDEETQEVEDEERKKARQKEERLLGDQVTNRLPPILERNRTLTRRVQRAATRCLPHARILLNAKVPSSTMLAEQAIESVGTSTYTPYFRLLDLPPEVLYLIVRHTSGDAQALSGTQFARLRKEAEGVEGLGRVMRMMKSKRRGWFHDDEAMERETNLEVRDEWLRWGKWDKWEAEYNGNGS